MTQFSDDLDTFTDDFGVTATWGSVSGLGVLDQPDQIIGGGISISTEYLLTVKAEDFEGIAFGDAITVDSTDYTVREVRKIDDGSFYRIVLTKE